MEEPLASANVTDTETTAKVFRSIFGGKKKQSQDRVRADDSIRSARAGDVVLIPGFWDDGEDAYLIVEEINRVESGYGESHEVIGVDGDRSATIEWTDHDGLHISAIRQDRPMGLSVLGVDSETLTRWDTNKSLDNTVNYDGHVYRYRNSFESIYFKGASLEGEGNWTWEFVRDDDEGAITVVKWGGVPFEVYVSEAISPHIVTVYTKGKG